MEEPEQIFFASKEEARKYLLELYKPVVKCIKINNNKYYSLEGGIKKLINGIASYCGKSKKIFFYLYNFELWKICFWRRYLSFFKPTKKDLEDKLVKKIVKVTNEEIMHYALEDAGLSENHHEVLAILSKILPEQFPNRKLPKKNLSKLLKE